MAAYDITNGQSFVHDGAYWKSERSNLNNLDEVGIGTGVDATNCLTVVSTASLLSHVNAAVGILAGACQHR
jgi:hypothetical protein